jgi:hypothetical protein
MIEVSTQSTVLSSQSPVRIELPNTWNLKLFLPSASHPAPQSAEIKMKIKMKIKKVRMDGTDGQKPASVGR